MFNPIQIAYAADMTAKGLLDKIVINVLDPIVYLMFTIATVVFIWGVFQFIRNAESVDGKEEGSQHILYGIIGLAIMLSVYGIIHILMGTIGK